MKLLIHNGKQIRIAFLSLPGKVHGVTMEADDCYIVAVNERDASITQRHALGHELAHIFLDHISSGKPIREAEKEANREAWSYYRIYKNSCA